MNATSLKKRGLPPGSIVYVGRQVAGPVQIDKIEYNEHAFEQSTVAPEQEEALKTSPKQVTWLNVDGVHDVKLIETLGQYFEIHPLTLEDIANTRQRPKCEYYDGYVFVALKMLRPNKSKNGGALAEHVSLILGDNFLISFQQEKGDVFDPVRERLRNNRGRIRKSGADYLCFSLMDAIVDGYFDVLEDLGERMTKLDNEVLTNPQPETLRRIHEMKRELVFLRRCVWPLRELASGLQKRDSQIIGDDVEIYLRDLYDHVAQIIDALEASRDVLSGLTDLYLSSVSNRMNEVMKMLTLIATIFIPITFIAGIYGMNFEHMPELQWRLSYPIFWLTVISVATGMLVYFKNKKWL